MTVTSPHNSQHVNEMSVIFTENNGYIATSYGHRKVSAFTAKTEWNDTLLYNSLSNKK
jgi:hypothetical protein